MRHFRLTILSLLCALLISSTAGAQSFNQLVYAFREGDLWKYNFVDNTATQLTEWGFNGGPILSPDGSLIAYLSTSDDFVSRWTAGTASQTSGTAPANIWVMETATEQFTLIADQATASAAGILRSLPVWSPTGRRLAWLQIDPNLQALTAATLQIHNLDTGITSTLVAGIDLGVQDSNIRMPSLRWGGGGIARLLFTYPEGGLSPFLYIEFYDATTGTLSRYNLNLNESLDNSVRDLEWVEHLGRSLLALQIQDYWELIDPLDGARTRLADPPRLKNRFLSGGIQLIPASVASASGGWDLHWYAALGGQLYNTGYKSARVNRNYRPGFSPDGSQMAWHNGDRISTWYPGITEANRALASDAGSRHAFPIPEPISAVWAPTNWVTTGATVSAQAAPVLPPPPSGCDLPPLLSLGNQAILSPGLANRVRSGPSLSDDRLGTIEEGEVVTIAAGPVCADGYHWYGVQNASIEGWTVEGSAGSYWLIYHVDCFDSPPTRLTKGMPAQVSSDRSLNIRDGVGTFSTNIISVAATGSELLITGLPACDSAGLRWYPVQVNLLHGWIAAGQGEDYWLEPLAIQSGA